MIDNFVILTNILLVLLVVIRSIMLDSRVGWFDPVNEPGHEENPSSTSNRRPITTSAVRTKKRRLLT